MKLKRLMVETVHNSYSSSLQAKQETYSILHIGLVNENEFALSVVTDQSEKCLF